MHVQGIAAKTSRWQVSVTSFPHATSKRCCVNVNECAPRAATEPEAPAWAGTRARSRTPPGRCSAPDGARGPRRRTPECGSRRRPTAASPSRTRTRPAASARDRSPPPGRHRAGATTRRLGHACRDCARPFEDRAAAPHYGAEVRPGSHEPTVRAYDSPLQKHEITRARRAVVLLVTPLVTPLLRPLVTPLVTRRFHRHFHRGFRRAFQPHHSA